MPTWSPIYERQRVPAVAPGAALLQARRCGACRIELDRGEIARIAAAADDEVLRCPECGAILVRIKDGLTSEGHRRGRRWFARQSGARRLRRRWCGRRHDGTCSPRASRPSGSPPTTSPSTAGLIAGLEAAAELGRHRGRRADGLQAGGGADVRALEGQAPGPDCADASRRRRSRGSSTATLRVDSAGGERHADRLANEAMDARRRALPTRAGSRLTSRRRSHASHRAGPAPAANRPGCCCCGTGRRDVRERRYSGRGNPALTDVGQGQARRAAQSSGSGRHRGGRPSPLQRAYDTAATAAKALGPRRHRARRPDRDRLRRVGGPTFREAAERDPELHRKWLRDTSVRPPDGRASTGARSGCSGSASRSSPSMPARRSWWSPT